MKTLTIMVDGVVIKTLNVESGLSLRRRGSEHTFKKNVCACVCVCLFDIDSAIAITVICKRASGIISAQNNN